MYKILIVDDEATERSVITFLLKKFNFPLQVTEASNGKEALQKLESHAYDLLFTDIRMPFIDGLTLAAQARDLYPKMPIIFFSGYDDFDYVKEALSLHVVNYILKPVNPEEFQQTIQKVIDELHKAELAAKQEQNTLEFIKNHILYQLVNRVSLDYLKSIYPGMDFSFVYTYHRLFLIQFEKDYFGPLPPDFINLNPSQNLLLFSGSRHRFDWYEQQAADVEKSVKKICGMNCSIAISDPFDDPQSLPLAYDQAEALLEERFFFTHQTLYSRETDEKASGELPPDINDDAVLKQLQSDIALKDTYSIRQRIHLLLNTWKAKKSLSMIYIRFISTSLLKTLLEGFPEGTPP